MLESPNLYFSWFSSPILYCYCKEKFFLDHSYELKGLMLESIIYSIISLQETLMKSFQVASNYKCWEVDQFIYFSLFFKKCIIWKNMYLHNQHWRQWLLLMIIITFPMYFFVFQCCHCCLLFFFCSIWMWNDSSIIYFFPFSLIWSVSQRKCFVFPFLLGKCRKRTTSGYCCVFPFTYGRRRYNRCAKTKSGRPWCPITPDYPRSKQWGYCRGYRGINEDLL